MYGQWHGEGYDNKVLNYKVGANELTIGLLCMVGGMEKVMTTGLTNTNGTSSN